MKELRKLKLRCLCCDVLMKERTKEHFWPLWLIKKANLHKKGVRWGEGFHSPRNTTIPLCANCNHALGSELEEPVSRIFSDIDQGKGISDIEAELLIRWLWKYEGYQSKIINFSNPNYIYSERWTLKDRLLNKKSLENIRPILSVAVSLIDKNLDDDQEWPVGAFYQEGQNAIFAAGVFYKISIMIGITDFINLLPKHYSKYKLNLFPNDKKVFFPQVGLENDVIAVLESHKLAFGLWLRHELAMPEDGTMEGLVIPQTKIIF